VNFDSRCNMDLNPDFSFIFLCRRASICLNLCGKESRYSCGCSLFPKCLTRREHDHRQGERPSVPGISSIFFYCLLRVFFLLGTNWPQGARPSFLCMDFLYFILFFLNFVLLFTTSIH
jgi:hypothetical protein